MSTNEYKIPGPFTPRPVKRVEIHIEPFEEMVEIVKLLSESLERQGYNLGSFSFQVTNTYNADGSFAFSTREAKYLAFITGHQWD